MVRVTKKLFKILSKKQGAFIGAIVVMMLLGGVIESFSVSLILPLVSAVMDTNGWSEPSYAQFICNIFNISDQRTYVKVVLILLIVAFIIKNIYLLFEYYVQYTFIMKARIQMIQKLMHAYLHKPYSFFLNCQSGEIIRTISGDVEQAFNLLSSLLNFATECFVSVIMGITVVIMSPQMATTLIAILLCEVLVIAKFIKPIMRRVGERRRKERATSSKWLLESINGIKSIKVASAEDFFEKNFKFHSDIETNDTRKEMILSNSPRLFIESITIVGVLSILFVSVSRGVEMSLLIPQLSAFAVAAMRLIPSANRMSTEINRIPYYEGGLDNVIRNMDLEKWEDYHSDAKEMAEESRMAFESQIKFCDITFAYEGTEKKIFDNASFSIIKGQSVGIVGPSGAGKTTAVDLMLGLLEPQEGKILVDGINIRDNMQGWLSNVAYIPQNIFLMDETIRANVGFGLGKKQIDDEKVWEALKQAQLEDFVKELPNGINTMVGEAGIRLSGGQRQRIGIARALYNNPEVLFFDEATSALDGETEAAIMDSIDSLKGNKTLIIIAHRLSTIQNCDVIFHVENGKIIPKSMDD